MIAKSLAEVYAKVADRRRTPVLPGEESDPGRSNYPHMLIVAYGEIFDKPPLGGIGSGETGSLYGMLAEHKTGDGVLLTPAPLSDGRS